MAIYVPPTLFSMPDAVAFTSPTTMPMLPLERRSTSPSLQTSLSSKKSKRRAPLFGKKKRRAAIDQAVAEGLTCERKPSEDIRPDELAELVQEGAPVGSKGGCGSAGAEDEAHEGVEEKHEKFIEWLCSTDSVPKVRETSQETMRTEKEKEQVVQSHFRVCCLPSISSPATRV